MPSASSCANQKSDVRRRRGTTVARPVRRRERRNYICRMTKTNFSKSHTSQSCSARVACARRRRGPRRPDGERDAHQSPSGTITALCSECGRLCLAHTHTHTRACAHARARTISSCARVYQEHPQPKCRVSSGKQARDKLFSRAAANFDEPRDLCLVREFATELDLGARLHHDACNTVWFSASRERVARPKHTHPHAASPSSRAPVILV